jgi:hypothetical protein
MLIPTRLVGSRVALRLVPQRQLFSTIPTEPNSSLFAKAKKLYIWLRQTAKEKGKPFIAWYASLYLTGLIASYGVVRAYGEVEPVVVKDWARTLKMDRLVDIESLELTKTNCEYLAALLLNEAVDTPRLIIAVLTVDRMILLGRKILRRGGA